MPFAVNTPGVVVPSGATEKKPEFSKTAGSVQHTLPTMLVRSLATKVPWLTNLSFEPRFNTPAGGPPAALAGMTALPRFVILPPSIDLVAGPEMRVSICGPSVRSPATVPPLHRNLPSPVMDPVPSSEAPPHWPSHEPSSMSVEGATLKEPSIVRSALSMNLRDKPVKSSP
jgi:hypothetical protein